mmetsp:Transcript_37563/g.103657  ORF Transcript_37563/g.103657 Transcript_37563/m.103657 type:complete len:272 (-) Transcript_37563:16-831(-)
MGVELEVVLIKVVEELIGAEHLDNLDELVIVVVAVKKGLLAEDHAGKHAAERPHVECVVVVLQVDEQLRPLEVPRRDAHVVLALGVVELGEAPIYQAQLPLLVVDHHVVRLHVAVHDPVGVAVLERLQQLKDIISQVKVRQRGVQLLEFSVVDILKDERRRLGLRVAHNIQELDDVGAAAQVLQDLDLALDLLLLHRLQDLDDNLCVVCDVDPLEHLAVLAAANLAHDLVVVLVPPLHLQRLVVPVVLGAPHVDVRMPPSTHQRQRASLRL